MYWVPLHMISLTEYLLSIEQIPLSRALQGVVRSLLNVQCVVDTGCVMMVISSCIVIPSTLGYVGAVRENRGALVMYFTPIIVLWVMQLVFIILLPVGKTILYSAVGWAGTWSLDHYRGEREELNLLTWVWNTGMAGLQCCGVQGYADFTNTT